MVIVHVFIHVKAEQVEAFQAATVENARRSLLEPGVVRVDVLQERDDPTRFVLAEAYRTPQDAIQHKETPHYKKWRNAVNAMMASPRDSIRYRSVFPDGKQTP